MFMRIAPAIEIIIDQNERSLHACEQMLSSLALAQISKEKSSGLKKQFLEALEKAKNNITEKEEPAAIEAISNSYEGSFTHDSDAREDTVVAIQELSRINRSAMLRADKKARQFGYAGAWAVVFMASAVFLVGILFVRGLRRSMVNPLEELHDVIKAFKSGNTMRRCTATDVPKDIRSIFDGFNDILDQIS
jgi:methyl-accepting chemotaxis protein